MPEPAEEPVAPAALDDQTKLRTAAALLPSDGLVALCWVRVLAFCNSKLKPSCHSADREWRCAPVPVRAPPPPHNFCVCVCVCVCVYVCVCVCVCLCLWLRAAVEEGASGAGVGVCLDAGLRLVLPLLLFHLAHIPVTGRRTSRRRWVLRPQLARVWNRRVARRLKRRHSASARLARPVTTSLSAITEAPSQKRRRQQRRDTGGLRGHP
jgi:hypothetical protein